MRQSDAFAGPGVGVRHETNRDLGPADPRPYLTAKDTPAPRTKPDASDGPTHRAADVEGPSGEELLEKDKLHKSRIDELREELIENFDEVHDWAESIGDKFTQALDRPEPTGHYLQCRPRVVEAHPANPYGVDAGTGAAAMLATGLFVGEIARRTYRKAAELKERSNARYG